MTATSKQFLQEIPPFSDLSEADVDSMLQHIQVKEFPKGTKIHRQGGPPAEYLYIVQKGAVKAYLEEPGGNEALVTYINQGETFGVISLIDGKTSTVTSETVEDTTCLLLDKEEFWRLFVTHPSFSEYFSKSLAKRLKITLGTVTRNTSPRSEALAAEAIRASVDISSLRVKDLISKRIVSCSPDTDVREAAGAMVENRVGSIIILDGDGAAAGIVTDTDLRRSVAAGYEGPVRAIMSRPVITVQIEALAFEAIYEMLRHGIHHIVVVDEGRPEGVISSSDLLAAHSDSPMFLAREIERAKSYAQLASVHSRTESMVEALVKRGVGAYNLGRITAETNDRLVQKIIDMVQADMAARGIGSPPVPYCWLGLGSEGRREQTLKTDQDNALIYQDPADNRVSQTQAYFQILASRVVEELVGCGFPPCKGGVMASNPRWCQPLSVWKEYFSKWVRESEPANLLNATIFFDFRPIWGDFSLSEELREHLRRETDVHKIFVGIMAKTALDHRPPLGFFRNIVVEKTGEHRGAVDLKRRGLLPLVDAVRVYSLEHGLATTNTFERVWDLEAKGAFSHDEATEIAGAYEFMMLLRIRHQIDQIKEGQQPDNFVNPDKLSRSERSLLKGYFTAISNLQSYLESHFLTWFMS